MDNNSTSDSCDTVIIATDSSAGASNNIDNSILSVDTTVFNVDHIFGNYGVVPTLLERLNIHEIDETGKCTSCKKEKQLIIKYSRNNFDRLICSDCITTIIDNLFGLNINIKTEKLLYGK